MEQLKNGTITAQQAAEQLDLSKRQILRIKKRFRRSGAKAIRHGNRGRSPKNKIPAEVKSKALGVFSEWRKRCDEAINSAHFCDILGDHSIKVSRQTTWRWLRERGAISSPRRRIKHRLRRERRSRRGELLFLDGSPHRWFGEAFPKSTLVLCSDDATTEALWGVFVSAEDRNSCFEVAYEVMSRLGIPSSFYLDRASQFVTTRHGGLHYNQTALPTHWLKAMKQLGVRCIFADSPQARGRGERINGTFQRRLVSEFQFHQIHDQRKATDYLNQKFIPAYNKKFAVSPAESQPAWRPISKGCDLRTILCAKSTREVSKDNTVLYENARYQLLPHPGWSTFADRPIEIQEWYNGTIHFSHSRVGLIRFKQLPKTKGQYYDKIAATLG